MLSLEKLSNSKLDIFKCLCNEKFKYNTYDKNFFTYYESESFFSKILLKKFVKLIMHKESVVGYIWYNIPVEEPLKIWSLYVRPDYISFLDESLLEDFDNNLLSYEESSNKATNLLLDKLGFKITKESYLMDMDLNLKNKFNYEKLKLQIESNEDLIYLFEDKNLNISFRRFEIGKDENLRCNLQNSIFHDKMRTEIEIEDIESDIKQEYYINDLSIFMYINNTAVGYGQVIFSRDMYTVVNFGILAPYRQKNLGKLLLQYIVNCCINRNIEKLYIRVDKKNTPAVDLYKKIGFYYKYSILNWRR